MDEMIPVRFRIEEVAKQFEVRQLREGDWESLQDLGFPGITQISSTDPEEVQKGVVAFLKSFLGPDADSD